MTGSALSIEFADERIEVTAVLPRGSGVTAQQLLVAVGSEAACFSAPLRNEMRGYVRSLAADLEGRQGAARLARLGTR